MVENQISVSSFNAEFVRCMFVVKISQRFSSNLSLKKADVEEGNVGRDNEDIENGDAALEITRDKRKHSPNLTHCTL